MSVSTSLSPCTNVMVKYYLSLQKQVLIYFPTLACRSLYYVSHRRPFSSVAFHSFFLLFSGASFLLLLISALCKQGFVGGQVPATKPVRAKFGPPPGQCGFQLARFFEVAVARICWGALVWGLEFNIGLRTTERTPTPSVTRF